MRRKFEVIFSVAIQIEVDESLVPDDEWRTIFYSPIKNIKDVAEHLAFNCGVHGASLSTLNGWADQPDDKVLILRQPGGVILKWETEEVWEI